MLKNSRYRRLLSLLSLTLLLAAVMVLYCNWRVKHDTAPHTFILANRIPHNRVGLVLGTSANRRDGKPNPYFMYRMQAAADLFRQQKVDFLILSGDNSSRFYNEPAMMKACLARMGIPENRIYLDYAGLRTLDSVVRCQKIFGQSRFTIISQAFHNQRAIFIARHFGIDAVGYNAQDVEGSGGLKTELREVFARVKVFLDLYLLNKQPKYLGEKIEIQ
jgi:SanA protein